MCFYATWRCGLNLAASPRLMNMADVTKRMLDLLATLQAGRAFSGEELATRLEISPRTLRRDVERLRGYGYPVATRPGPGDSYQLAAGQRMPPIVLDDEERVATVVGLATLAAATPSHARRRTTCTTPSGGHSLSHHHRTRHAARSRP